MGNFISREMLEFLVMISNYLMALCMGFYTLDCFWSFKYREESTGGILYIRQNFWMFVIQFLSFFNLPLWQNAHPILHPTCEETQILVP